METFMAILVYSIIIIIVAILVLRTFIVPRKQTDKTVPENDTQAVKWYLKRAELGNVEAQFQLGVMYQKGKGVPENDAEAVKWFSKAAEWGDAEAQFHLGCMYRSHKSIPKDNIKAYQWFLLSAAQGNKAAKFNKLRMAKEMTTEEIAKAQELSATYFADNH